MPGIPATITIEGRTPATIKGRVAPLINTAEAARGGYRAGDDTGGGASPSGTVVFDTDMDNQPDWQSQHTSQRYKYNGDTSNDGSSGFAAQDNIPPTWDFYYLSDKWDPYGDKNGEGAVVGSRPVGAITSEFGNHLGPSGKSFVTWDESYGGPGQWGSDTDLIKDLNSVYTDIVEDFWLKMQPGFQWEAVNSGSGQSSLKLARGRYYTGGEFGQRFGLDLDVDASFIVNIKAFKSADGSDRARIKVELKQYPNEINKSVIEADMGTISDTIGNGGWQHIVIRAKMNSEAGVADGKLQVAFNDTLLINLDVEIITQDPGAEIVGWNQVGMGGNANNVWAPEEDQAEQWWALSGFKVYSGVPDEYKSLLGDS